MKAITEKQQVRYFAKWLKSIGLKYKYEVPVLLKFVDLVVLDGNVLTAMEFKLEDWRRAIEQVNAYSASFDKIAICIMRPATQKTICDVIKACTDKGIGLYFTSFNEDNTFFCEYVVEAKPVERIWRLQRDSLIKQIGWKSEVCSNT